MATGNAERLETALDPFADRDAVEMFEDAEAVEDVRRRLAAVAVPELDGAMVGSEGGLINAWSGIEGFIDAWREFLQAFSRFENEIEDMIESGDVIVVLTHQTAITTTGGVTVENDDAGVFTFADGRLRRAEFHLDRESAMRGAGLNPADYSGQE